MMYSVLRLSEAQGSFCSSHSVQLAGSGLCMAAVDLQLFALNIPLSIFPISYDNTMRRIVLMVYL